MWWILLILVICLAWVILTLVFSWCWHALISHTQVPGVAQTHLVHHQDVDDLAHRDFYWIAVLLLLLTLALFTVYVLGIVLYPVSVPFWEWLVFFLWLVPVLIFILEYYLHYSYHQDDSWLGHYSWFQQLRADHYAHHQDETVNYGISNHWVDWLMGKYKKG